MITYNKNEVKRAILKTFPVGEGFLRSEWETIKWHLILNDGFERKGFLNEAVFFVAIGELKHEGRFKKRKNSTLNEKVYIRIK